MTGRKYWNEIEGARWSEIVELQDRMFREQLSYIYHNAPFFRRKIDASKQPLDAFKIAAHIASIPPTTKEEIRSSMEEAPPLGAHQAAPSESLARICSSSGTTGRPVYHGCTAADVQAFCESWARAYFATGVRPGDRAIYLFAMSGGYGSLFGHEALQYMGCTVIPAGAEQRSEKTLRLMKDLRPNVIASVPSFPIYLAERCEELIGMKPSELGVKKMSVGGEPVLGVRQQLCNVWGADWAREYMGMSEVALIWGECEEEHGMHYLCPDQVLVELINPDTLEIVPWKEGNTGEIVYTSLVRRGSPLLRYRTRDFVIVTSTTCACGRTGPVIRCSGRTDDMLKVKGMNVFPSAVAAVLEEFQPNMTGEFRIILARQANRKALSSLLVKAETAASPGERRQELRDRVVGAVRARLGVQIDLELVGIGELGRQPRASGQVRREIFEFVD